jgi:hypothetical protein
VSSDTVRFSYYEKEGEILAFVANMVIEESGEVCIELPHKASEVFDAIGREVIARDVDTLKLELGGFDHRILIIK